MTTDRTSETLMPGGPLRGRPWLQTSRGLAWCADAPHLYPYDAAEIAYALSNLCRFAGHTTAGFYSVSQHSVLVAQEVEAHGHSKAMCRAALLHDAAEAFLVDMPQPIKVLPELAGYRKLLKDAERAIAEHFGLHDYIDAPEIRRADLVLLATEKRDVLGESPHDGDWGRDLPSARAEVIRPLLPTLAMHLFLSEWVRFGGAP